MSFQKLFQTFELESCRNDVDDIVVTLLVEIFCTLLTDWGLKNPTIIQDFSFEVKNTTPGNVTNSQFTGTRPRSNNPISDRQDIWSTELQMTLVR